MTNGLSHPYHLDEFTFIFRGIRSNFSFHFSMNFLLQANRIASDVTPCFAASHLGLFCLPMSHKKDARLIWVNVTKSNKQYHTLHKWNTYKLGSDFSFQLSKIALRGYSSAIKLL